MNGDAMPELRIVRTVDGNLEVVVLGEHQDLKLLAGHQREGVPVRLLGPPLLGLDRVAHHPRWGREHGAQVQGNVVPGVHVGAALEVDGEASR